MPCQIGTAVVPASRDWRRGAVLTGATEAATMSRRPRGRGQEYPMHRTPTRLLLAALLCWAVAACSGEEAPDKDAGDDGDDGSAAFEAGTVEDTAGDGGGGASDSAVGGDTTAVPDAAQGTDAAVPVDAGCKPDCKGKVCGPDGCGSVCGFCATGDFCAKDGSACAAFCQPKCDGKACGDNGCGGDCGQCSAGKVCGVDALCHLEACEGSCEGKVCGDNGCGKLCGTCASGDVCSSSGQCKPSPCKGIPAEGKCDGEILIGCNGEGLAATKTTTDCSAQLPVGSKHCAWDPLTSKHACVQKPACVPTCTKADGGLKECGDDGCGGLCKSCLEGWACEVDTCKVKPGGACGGTFNQKTGACDGDTWLLCSAGKVVAVDCKTAGKKCTWTGSAYGCK